MESDWQEVSSLLRFTFFIYADYSKVNRMVAAPPAVGPYPAVAPALAFDSNAELLWVGNDQVRY